jgi:hypothetical protein
MGSQCTRAWLVRHPGLVLPELRLYGIRAQSRTARQWAAAESAPAGRRAQRPGKNIKSCALGAFESPAPESPWRGPRAVTALDVITAFVVPAPDYSNGAVGFFRVQVPGGSSPHAGGSPRVALEAYLLLRQGNAAGAEFQKYADHGSVVNSCPLGALARLGLARAYALQNGGPGSRRGKGESARMKMASMGTTCGDDRESGHPHDMGTRRQLLGLIVHEQHFRRHRTSGDSHCFGECSWETAVPSSARV